LIGLTGHLGAGKDTVASILVTDFGFRRAAWTDSLKREVYEAFGKLILKDLAIKDAFKAHDMCAYFSLERGDTFSAWLEFLDAHKYDAPDSEFGWIRPLLQFWGTEYRRHLCADDYWTQQLTLTPGLVITDCRFPNEAQAIMKAGGDIWRVERPGYRGDNHPSETHVDSMPRYMTVFNVGSVEELRGQVHDIMDRSYKITTSV
jgi:hypothetical protein